MHHLDNWGHFKTGMVLRMFNSHVAMKFGTVIIKLSSQMICCGEN